MSRSRLICIALLSVSFAGCTTVAAKPLETVVSREYVLSSSRAVSREELVLAISPAQLLIHRDLGSYQYLVRIDQDRDLAWMRDRLNSAHIPGELQNNLTYHFAPEKPVTAKGADMNRLTVPSK